ncbi:hypothetical protein HGRIS_010349 [Hohenbuehelia grisea]|uniref:RelA/SpoT domain-containing protein n=1 Tax=Hohenbuehelia grisea TaxID=104357 RepID=A0ABR3J419_9AGAR
MNACLMHKLRRLCLKFAFLWMGVFSIPGVASYALASLITQLTERCHQGLLRPLEILPPLNQIVDISTLSLQDFAFGALHPLAYAEIDQLVNLRAPHRKDCMLGIIRSIRDDLRSLGIHGEVIGRQKRYSSIFDKMEIQGRPFDDIYDLIGIRVLVDSTDDCYAVLKAIHLRWPPIPSRFKDFIAAPKTNFYRSVHTTIVELAGTPVELQIRTYEMHRQAESGSASHSKYKESMYGKKGALALV